MGRILFGIFFCGLCLMAGALAWLSFGKVPVAVSDPPFPFERTIVDIPLNERINKEEVRSTPFPPDEENLVAGARIYVEKCAVCHGLHGKPSSIGSNMYPPAPPLWEKHKNSNFVGVSDDSTGETFWKVKNGIRLSGMPTYQYELSDMQIWQVSLLLSHADKPLPPAALELLRPAPATENSAEEAKRRSDLTYAARIAEEKAQAEAAAKSQDQTPIEQPVPQVRQP
jgi:thiosulfate dehydrogenase